MRFFIAAILLFTCFGLQAQDSLVIDSLMKQHKIVGAGVATIKNKKISSVKTYGELIKGTPAQPDAIFNVASLTKPLVVMLTLKLVNKNEWNLDEPLANYFTDPDVASDPRSKKLTSRHVLSHQTGFVNWRWLHPTKKLTFDADPGTKFGYSGEGFEYLAKALGAKFNKSLEQLVKEEIFDPLGMKDSRLTWSPSIETRYARNHDRNGLPTYKTFIRKEASAADDLLTTLHDYATFCVAVMKGFELNESLFREMVRPAVEMRKNMYMGLGWQLMPNLRDGHYVMGHDGGDEGVKTMALFDPVRGEGFVFFSNSDNGFDMAPYVLTSTMTDGKEILKKITGE